MDWVSYESTARLGVHRMDIAANFFSVRYFPCAQVLRVRNLSALSCFSAKLRLPCKVSLNKVFIRSNNYFFNDCSHFRAM